MTKRVILVKRLVKRRYQKDSWKLEGAYLLVSSECKDLLRGFDEKINPEEEFPDFIDLIDLLMKQIGVVFVPALGIRLEINETKTEVVWNIPLLLKIEGMKIETVDLI